MSHRNIIQNSGPQGCVPVENMAQTSCVVQLTAELIPTVSEAVRMCEERGGSLAHDATFGTDPLDQDKTYLLMLCMVTERAIEYFVDVTTYLGGFLTE